MAGKNIFGLVTTILVGVAVALPAAADWDVYVAGGLGISNAYVDTDGQQSVGPTLLTGDDWDSSPLIDGAVGLRIPMNELLPREWLLDVRLPDWPVRFELEAAGLREHELRTDAGPDAFFTEMKTTTTMVNTWVDVPLTTMYRPIQYTFGLGRQPRVRQWLEPASFYWGVGVGFAAIDVRGTSNAISASDDFLEFAWNAGMGFNYALTENVDISAGYRYVGLAEGSGELSLTPVGGAPTAADDLEYEIQIHEFRAQVRVEVYSFLSPWR